MNKSVEEKRKFNRIPFSYQDNIVGVFVHPGKQDKIDAHILNLSMQGMYFTLRKEEWSKLSENDRLVVLEIKGPRNDNYIVNIEMTVKRILDYTDLEFFGYGCKFTSLPDSSLEQMKRFLETWFLQSRAS